MKRSFILPPPVIHTVCFYFSDEGLSDSLWYGNKRQKAIFHLVKDGLLERKTRSFAFQKTVFYAAFHKPLIINTIHIYRQNMRPQHAQGYFRICGKPQATASSGTPTACIPHGA